MKPAITTTAIAIGGAIAVALVGGLGALGLSRFRPDRGERPRVGAADLHRHMLAVESRRPRPPEVSSTVLSLRYLHEGIKHAAPGATSDVDVEEVHKLTSDVETALDSLVSSPR